MDGHFLLGCVYLCLCLYISPFKVLTQKCFLEKKPVHSKVFGTFKTESAYQERLIVEIDLSGGVWIVMDV